MITEIISLFATAAFVLVALIAGLPQEIMTVATAANTQDPTGSAPSLLLPIIVAVLSGGGVTALANLFLYRSNRDSIIAQAAENMTTAQQKIIKDLRIVEERLRDENEELRHRIAHLEAANAALRRRLAESETRTANHINEIKHRIEQVESGDAINEE